MNCYVNLLGVAGSIGALGAPRLAGRRNIRIDRVKGGFLVYYGTINELRLINPKIIG